MQKTLKQDEANREVKKILRWTVGHVAIECWMCADMTRRIFSCRRQRYSPILTMK
jgi:hypothetical protein